MVLGISVAAVVADDDGGGWGCCYDEDCVVVAVAHVKNSQLMMPKLT